MWSEAQQRWVHLDPCEAAYDKPLLYEVRQVWCGGTACRLGRGAAAQETSMRLPCQVAWR